MGDLESKARDENINLPSDIELVLEIVPWDNEVICGYYFVEHSSRCLFWLEEFDAEGICEEIKAVVSLSHLRESYLYGEVQGAMYLFSGRVRDRVPVLVGIDIWKTCQNFAKFWLIRQDALGTIPEYSRLDPGPGR